MHEHNLRAVLAQQPPQPCHARYPPIARIEGLHIVVASGDVLLHPAVERNDEAHGVSGFGERFRSRRQSARGTSPLTGFLIEGDLHFSAPLAPAYSVRPNCIV